MGLASMSVLPKSADMVKANVVKGFVCSTTQALQAFNCMSNLHDGLACYHHYMGSITVC